MAMLWRNALGEILRLPSDLTKLMSHGVACCCGPACPDGCNPPSRLFATIVYSTPFSASIVLTLDYTSAAANPFGIAGWYGTGTLSCGDTLEMLFHCNPPSSVRVIRINSSCAALATVTDATGGPFDTFTCGPPVHWHTERAPVYIGPLTCGCGSYSASGTELRYVIDITQ